MKPFKYFLPIFTIALVIINLGAKIYLEESMYLWILFGTMISFSLLFISPWYYNNRGLLLFGLLFISDGIFIFLEDPIFNALMFLVKTGIYSGLIWIVLKSLKNLESNLFQKIIFALAVILNVFLLHYLLEMMPVAEYTLLFNFMFYLYGFSIILCVTTAMSYNNRYADKSSIFFLGAVLSLVLSDLTYFIAFILGFDVFFLVDRTFNIVGIALLLQFFRLDIKERIVRSNEFVN